MIVTPTGTCCLVITNFTLKRVVDSVSGNPRTFGHIEIFSSRAELINSNIGKRYQYECSAMSDFTVAPKSFNEIEKWLIDHDTRFCGGTHEAA